MLALGLLLAIASTACDNLGVVLQASEARRQPPELALRLGLVVRLARRRVWLIGGTLILAGFVLQTAALTQAPLTVVQPAIALGLVVLVLASARVLGQRPTVAQLAAITVLGGAVAGVALLSPQTESDPGASSLLAIGGVALLIAAGPYALHARTGRNVSVAALALGAGAGYAGVALLMKAFAESLADGDWLALTLLGPGMALLGGSGFLLEETALSVGRATTVTPLILLLQVGAPVALDIVLFGQGVPRGARGAAFLACLAAAVLAAMTLARSPATTGFRDEREDT